MIKTPHPYRTALAAGLIPLLSACVIPVPIPLGSEVTSNDISRYQREVTHRSQVLAKLGEPNIHEEDGFDVYQLDEGKLKLIFFGLTETNSVKETYNLVFSYDANGLVRELRYDKSITHNDPSLSLLENRFAERSEIFPVNESFFTIDVSPDGRWISAVSRKRFVFHELGGESREIMRHKHKLPSLSQGHDCMVDLAATHRGKQNPELTWLHDKPDLIPFYRLCVPYGALTVAQDGNSLAVADLDRYEVWSLENGKVRAGRTGRAPILGLSLDANDKYALSFGFDLKTIKLFGGPRVVAELDILSLPWLNPVKSIRRETAIRAATFSSDGVFFALATDTHVELWQRQGAAEQDNTRGWPYKLTRLIPKPPLVKGASHLAPGYNIYTPGRSLKFSPDSKYLMHVDSLLHLWDIGDGRLVTRIGSLAGIIEAAFNQDDEVVVVSGKRSNVAWSTPFGARFKSIKTWRLPLGEVTRQYDFSETPVSNLGLRAVAKLASDSATNSADSNNATATGNTNLGTSLTPEEWRGLLAGNTASGRSETGNWFHVYHHPDGRMDGKTNARMNSRMDGNSDDKWDTGTWQISDEGLFCRQWKWWRGGSRHCYSMHRLVGNRYRFQAVDKPDFSVFSIRPGDPERLRLD